MVHSLKSVSPGESLSSTSSAGVVPVASASSRCLASVLQFLSISACHTVQAQGDLPFANAESWFKHSGSDPMTPPFTSERSSAFNLPADSSSSQTDSPVTSIQETFWNKALHRHAPSAWMTILSSASKKQTQPLVINSSCKSVCSGQ